MLLIWLFQKFNIPAPTPPPVGPSLYQGPLSPTHHPSLSSSGINKLTPSLCNPTKANGILQTQTARVHGNMVVPSLPGPTRKSLGLWSVLVEPSGFLFRLLSLGDPDRTFPPEFLRFYWIDGTIKCQSVAWPRIYRSETSLMTRWFPKVKLELFVWEAVGGGNGLLSFLQQRGNLSPIFSKNVPEGSVWLWLAGEYPRPLISVPSRLSGPLPACPQNSGTRESVGVPQLSYWQDKA